MLGIMTPDNWIGHLPPMVREAVFDRMRPVELSAGEVLRAAGDPPVAMHYIDRGYVRLLGLHNDGRQVLLLIYKPGNSCGESVLVTRRRYNHTTVALTDARVLRLPVADFWELYHAHSEIPEALCRKFATAITRQFGSRELQATQRLRKLVALTFENLAVHCGQAEPDGSVVIDLPFTQTDLADHHEVSRQAVQREVAVLKAEGLLAKRQGRWRVLDPRGLHRV